MLQSNITKGYNDTAFMHYLISTFKVFEAYYGNKPNNLNEFLSIKEACRVQNHTCVLP